MARCAQMSLCCQKSRGVHWPTSRNTQRRSTCLSQLPPTTNSTVKSLTSSFAMLLTRPGTARVFSCWYQPPCLRGWRLKHTSLPPMTDMHRCLTGTVVPRTASQHRSPGAALGVASQHKDSERSSSNNLDLIVRPSVGIFLPVLDYRSSHRHFDLFEKLSLADGPLQHLQHSPCCTLG